jgi:hypothetical protein
MQFGFSVMKNNSMGVDHQLPEVKEEEAQNEGLERPDVKKLLNAY